MRQHSVFHLIAKLSNKAGISCVLIGGFAVNYYKLTRQTADVDFLITKEDFDRIADDLENEGFKLDCIENVFARFKGNRFYLMDVDFMFVDKDTLNKIIKDGKEITIEHQKFTVPSLNTLIALKLHAIKYNQKIREYKDLPDVINLIRINKIDYKSNKFRAMCLKYGTQGLYKKILDGAKP